MDSATLKQIIADAGLTRDTENDTNKPVFAFISGENKIEVFSPENARTDKHTAQALLSSAFERLAKAAGSDRIQSTGKVAPDGQWRMGRFVRRGVSRVLTLR